MAAIVYEGGHVKKSDRAVFQQVVLNKLWIPDDMINEIKDFLYISAEEVLRKFYRLNVNMSITNLVPMTTSYMVDIYGRQRLAHWGIGHIYGDGNVQKQGLVCVTCGDSDTRHQTVPGCCRLMWDDANGEIDLMPEEEMDVEIVDETIGDINAESVEIPEVTWEIDIPVSPFIYTDPEQAEFVLNALIQAREESYQADLRQYWFDAMRAQEYDDFDRESEAADYAEYMREMELEERSSNYGR